MNLNDLPRYGLNDSVVEWFKKSISAADSMARLREATGCGRDNVPDPSREPKFVLADMAKQLVENDGWLRFVLENEAANYALTIDFTPVDIKQCPEELVEETLLMDEKTGHKSKEVARVPLLCCRYIRHEKGHSLLYKEENWVNSLCEAGFNFNSICTKTTSACIDYIHDEILEKHGSWLAASYIESWHDESPFNREGYFKPGFIVPLPKKLALTAKKMPGNTMLCANHEGGCVNPGTKACAGCMSCHYCSVDCQKQHWKEHKKVCGKSAEDLAATDTGSGSSVVVAITDETPLGSMSNMNFSTQSHNGGVSASVRAKDLHRNIHGDRKFLVKIQTSLKMGDGGLKMGGGGGLIPNPLGALTVYDQTKSFTFYIMPHFLTEINALRKDTGGKTTIPLPQPPQQSPSSHDHPRRRLYEAITTRGVPCMNLGGLKGKGYFWSRREGANLRIFINEQEPVQPW